uniref:Pre-mRNA splicing Prp18-interacting factor n=1 Tax=Tanacetum cinerariifolium TaxID=118510 RepID=A0A6L2K218_TANCI|nr:hypothetical protein [Tanacetum cinerariifolium]
MTSFDYRLNPHYAIKECSSCGALYTRDCCCSKGNVKDKILVPKLPKNCARCARCGHPVDGPYCQGCALLQQELEENLVTHSQDFQNTFESSNDSTNVVNAPREPFVVKQNHESFVDKIIFDLNRVPDSPHLHTISPNQFHCFHCKDVLGDVFLKILHKVLRISTIVAMSVQYTVNHPIFNAHNDHLDSQIKLNIALTKLMKQMTSLTSFCEMACQIVQKKQEEKQLEEEQAAKAQNWKLPVCYDDDNDEERSNSLKDNIISGLPLCSAITPNEPVLSTEEPDNSLSMGDEHLDTIPETESDEVIKSSVENLIPIQSESEGIPEHMCDVPFHDNSPPLDVLKDQFEDFSESNDEFSSPADDSFSIDNIDYVEASPPDSELVSSEVMEIVIPKVRGIDDDILLTIKDDILREKLLNVNLLIAKIEALNANPTPSFDFKTKSSSTSLNSLLEETNTFDNSLPAFETFCFDVEEISSDSTTTHSDISLPEYEAFYDDHVKEISSGSLTTHSDSSLYASFIFDLLINPFPPADRSDFYAFADELIPFTSPPKYDCFLFKVEPNSRDFTKDVVEDISPNKEPKVHNALPTHPILQLNLKFQPSSESLFTYVVWIFLPFLEYSAAPY